MGIRRRLRHLPEVALSLTAPKGRAEPLFGPRSGAESFGRSTLRGIAVEAFAKINLGLAVTARRADGYHEIETVFQSVSLSDTVVVEEAAGRGLSLSAAGLPVPVDESNLAWRAADAMVAALGCPAVAVRLEKRIPVAAGLGGGSADAAAVIAGVDALYGVGASREELAEIALGIGSDVPFMLTGGTALGTGRGERLEPLPTPRGVWFVLVTPAVAVSAAEAYRAARIRLTGARDFIRVNCSAIREGDIPALLRGLRNDLEAGVVPACPEVPLARDALLEGGARAAVMSGSGPTVFGVVDSKAEGDSLASRLAGRGWTIHVVAPIEFGLSIADREGAR